MHGVELVDQFVVGFRRPAAAVGERDRKREVRRVHDARVLGDDRAAERVRKQPLDSVGELAARDANSVHAREDSANQRRRLWPRRKRSHVHHPCQRERRRLDGYEDEIGATQRGVYQLDLAGSGIDDHHVRTAVGRSEERLPLGDVRQP